MSAQRSSSTSETEETEETEETDELFQKLGDAMQRFKKIKFQIDTLKKSKKKCSTISKELLQAQARHEKIVKDYHKTVEEASERREKSINDLREMHLINMYCGTSDTDLKIIANNLDKRLLKTAKEVQPLLKTISSLTSLPAKFKQMISSPEYKAVLAVRLSQKK